MVRNILYGVLVLTSPLHAAEPQPLFNGRNFEGWTFDILDPAVEPAAVWSVSEGVLVCKGRPPGVIRSVGEFSNYELSLEWRWAPGAKPGNSGVLIHASKPREMFAWPRSVEVQLGHGNAGDFWTIGETLAVEKSEAIGRRWLKKGEPREKEPGEWNHVRIRCQGAKVSVWVNGTLMNEGTDLSATRGAICFQSEGGEVHFRKIDLTALK